MTITIRLMPEIITQPGKYLTRCGETVEIHSVWRKSSFQCWADGQYANGVKESWHPSGRLLPFNESQNDIIAKTGEQ